ncbi:hypothetical protein BCR35DRAFT_335570 [Leucosporidium creatinivorum]|uniref:Uncharacterized protein n=1 Tax=Leucosporidium creatinivorum TaxID=106004 RepID=A0A1Y2D958_9BASI|nr:hypothetical protein BCR35DRAFT_335570 [Leucosporidium creatinivorum]
MSAPSLSSSSAQGLIDSIKSGDLVKVVLLLQRLELDELETVDPSTSLTPLLVLVSESPTRPRLLALQLFLLKGVTKSVLSALDKARECRNSEAVDLMSKWAWGKKEDASWLTTMLTMDEDELTIWVANQKMGDATQKALDRTTGEGRETTFSASALEPIPRLQPPLPRRSSAGDTPSPVGGEPPVQRLPFRNGSALLPRKPTPPDLLTGIASLPPRPTPVYTQSIQSRKRPHETAFAPLPTLPPLRAPPPSAFSSDPSVLTIHGLPVELSVGKKDIFELLKSHGAERLDVRELKMQAVKAPKDGNGKKVRDAQGKKIGGTMKVEVDFHSIEVCDEVGSSLEGKFWRGVKVQVEWTRSSPRHNRQSWRLPRASPTPSPQRSDDELVDTPSRRRRIDPPLAPAITRTLTPASNSSKSSDGTARRMVDYSDL